MFRAVQALHRHRHHHLHLLQYVVVQIVISTYTRMATALCMDVMTVVITMWVQILFAAVIRLHHQQFRLRLQQFHLRLQRFHHLLLRFRLHLQQQTNVLDAQGEDTQDHRLNALTAQSAKAMVDIGQDPAVCIKSARLETHLGE